MWTYDKKLQFPVNIKNPNAKLAKLIISQFGGPDGELGASMRYLSQRYTMPYKEVIGILTDVGTEELAHMEMVCAIVYQLTKNLTLDQIKEQGFDAYFVDHTTGLYPVAASGVPWNANTFQSTGDAIADITEDLAAEGTMVKEQPVIPTPQKAFHQFLIKMLYNIFISDGEAVRRHSVVPKKAVNTDFQHRKMLNCALHSIKRRSLFMKNQYYFMRVFGLSEFSPQITTCDLIRTTIHKITVGQAVFKGNYKNTDRDYSM